MIPLGLVVAVGLLIALVGVITGVLIVGRSDSYLGIICGWVLFGASMILALSSIGVMT